MTTDTTTHIEAAKKSILEKVENLLGEELAKLGAKLTTEGGKLEAR